MSLSHASRDLTDKVVVITGAGSGIGRALAVLAARGGALLALSDWDAEGLAGTVRLVEDAGAAKVRHDVVDVSDRDAVRQWAAWVVEELGRVNLVVNNAGVTATGDFTDLTYDDLDWIVGINFWGVVHGSKEFLPHLIASGDGALVNISSLFGLVSVPGQSAYNATKYAVRGLTEAIREEMLVAGHPVTVTCVHPGGIRTGISRHGRKAAGLDGSAIDALFEKKLARMSPDRAAEIILDGALAGKARVLVGLDAHLIHQFARLAGARYQDVVARVASRMPVR
jgi:NAD(P)-dependent dehydrogenase (short-subunit alcohol dehydrogenase family)